MPVSPGLALVGSWTPADVGINAAAAAPIEVMVGVFALLLAAKTGEELFRRLRQPAVVGELLGGFVVGPHALGLVLPGEAILVFAEIGVVILLFQVGLEVRLNDLLRVGRSAVLVALAAMALPIAAGVAIGLLAGETGGAAAFIGLALAATSIGITSRVLAEAGVLQRPFARIVLGAAVVDDILALVAIGVVSAFATGSQLDRALVLGVSAVGVVILGLAAARRARGLRREVFTWPLFADTPLVPSFLVMLALALVSALAGLAALIGAFIAGLIVAETEARDELEHEIRPLGLIFTPFFFGVTGTALDLGAILVVPVAGLAVALTVVGVATKALGGYLGAFGSGRWQAIAVGVGMVPRGEVGIVVANLGLAAGLLSTEVFAAVLLAVVGTTIVAPYLLAWAVPRAVAEEAGAT